MRKAVLVLTLMLIVVAGSSLALADTGYTITGIYDNLTSTTGVSIPGGEFSFAFTVSSSSLGGDANGLFSGVFATYSASGVPNLAGSMTANFNPAGFPGATPNLAINYFDASGNLYLWLFSVSSDLFSGNSLNYGNFSILGDGSSNLLAFEAAGFGSGTILEGNISANYATPEPGAFLLMGSGILGLGGVIRRKLLL